MRNSFTLALAADRGTRLLADHARYQDAYLSLSNIALARVIRNHPNASAGLARLQADVDAIEVEPLDDSLLGRIAGAFNVRDSDSFHEPNHDHTAPDDTQENRVIPAPGAVPAVVEDEEEYVKEWDGGE